MATLRAVAREQLRTVAADAYPSEGCGVLIGTGDEVVEATAGRNLREDRSRDRYELDPGAIVAAERSARSRGLEVVGFWHSHPDHPAEPSAFDQERAWTEYLYVIVRTTADGAEDARGWRLERDGGAFLEVPLAGREA